MDTQLGLVVALVSWPLLLTGLLTFVGAVLALIGAVVGFATGAILSAVLLLIVAVLAVVVGRLWMIVSGKVRQNARWAYAVAAIAYLLPSVPTLLGVSRVPPGVLPDWYMTAQTVFAILYVILGALAVVLFVASYMSEGGEEAAPTSTEVR